jgi:hypothetical protein
MQNFAFLFTPMPAIIFLVPILLIAIVLLVAINKTKTLDATSALPTSPMVTKDQTPLQAGGDSGSPVAVQTSIQATEAPSAVTIPVVSESVTYSQEGSAHVVTEAVTPIVEATDIVATNPSPNQTQSTQVVAPLATNQTSESVQPVSVAVRTDSQEVEVPVVEPLTISFKPGNPPIGLANEEDKPFTSNTPEQTSYVPEVAEESVQTATSPRVEEVLQHAVDYTPVATTEELVSVQSPETFGVESSAPSQSSVPSPIVARASSRLRPVL